jgi:hypothetical protein
MAFREVIWTQSLASYVFVHLNTLATTFTYFVCFLGWYWDLNPGPCLDLTVFPRLAPNHDPPDL